jgi:ABC-2 type transport system permease protein
MKKYLYIYKSEVMSNLQYTFDLLIGFIGYIIHIFIFLNLWKYMYSDPNELINGYSMNQMIWYVIITELLWSVVGGRSLMKKISNDVKSGNVAYNINKPYNYVEYSLFNHLGGSTVKFVILTVIAMVLGFIFLNGFPPLSILQILAVLFSALLATIISILLIITLGLLSFFIEDAAPFYWIYSKFILVIGTIFPIEFFPEILKPFIKFSPIYAVSYGPAKLFVDFNMTDFISIMISQISYLVISFIICHLIYKKGVRKLNVNGG